MYKYAPVTHCAPVTLLRLYMCTTLFQPVKTMMPGVAALAVKHTDSFTLSHTNADQGDRVAGRVSRADVAAVAVAALSDPSAAGVTFELSSKAELPPANQLASIFEGLAKD